MTTTIEQKSPVSARLKISVPAAQVNERLNAYFQNIAQKAKVPGFRPGKAPKDVVKKMYSEDTAADLSERLISEYLVGALREHSLDIVMPPMLIATDTPAEGKDFSFEVEVDLRPRVPAINLKNLEVDDVATAPVTDDDVNNELNSYREHDASFVDLKDNRPIRDKDCVVISFKGSVDGVEREDMASESHTLVLGQGQFLKEFENALMGMSAGETKEFPLTFPENYGEESLAGKTAKFSTTVKSIKEKLLPEMNDAFAKQVDPEVQSLLELRLKVRKRLEDHRESRKKDAVRDRVGDALVQRHNFEVSKRQVENFAQKLAEQTHHMMHQMGIQHEENEDHFKSLMESSAKKAERDIRLTYILEAIAKDKKIEVTEADIEKRLEATAKRTGASIAQIRAHYSAEDEESGASKMERLMIDIRDEKSLDYALSQATIKNKGSIIYDSNQQ